MKQVYKSIYALIIVSIMMFSCKMQEVVIGDIDGLKINEINKKSLNLEVLLPIDNPNKFNFKITNVNLDIELNGVSLGKVKEVKNIKVLKKSNEVHNFLVEVEFSKLLAGSVDLVLSLMKKKADLKLKGTVTVGAFMLRKKIPIDVDKPVKLFKK